MDVQGVSVLIVKGLGHETGMKAMFRCNHMCYITKQECTVRSNDRRRTFKIDFVLGRADFVMGLFKGNIALCKDIYYTIAYIFPLILGVGIAISRFISI